MADSEDKQAEVTDLTRPSKDREVKEKDVAQAKDVEHPDAFMAQTMAAMEWAGKRRKQIALGVVFLAILGGSYAGYALYRGSREEKASALLSKGTSAELGFVKEGAEDPDVIRRLAYFDNEEQRQQTALASFAEVRAKYPDTGAGILGRLGEAGVMLDRGMWDDAISAYGEVRNSALANADGNIRLRCIEGQGYAREGKGLADEARKSFEELANLDVKGAKSLGLFHQARLDLAKNDKSGAIAKLKQARELAVAPGAPAADYTKDQIDKLLGRLDPTAIPKKPAFPPNLNLSLPH